MHLDDPLSAESSSAARLESGAADVHQPPLHRLISAVCAPALSLSGDDGQIRSEGAQGLFVHDVRVLSECVLTVDGREPVSIGWDIGGGNHNQFDSTIFNVGAETPDPVIFLSRRRVVDPRGMNEEITITSYARKSVTLHLRLKLACDMAAIATVKSGRRLDPQTGTVEASRLLWGQFDHGSVEAFGTPEPDFVDPLAGTLSWSLTIEPGTTGVIVLSVQRHGGPPAVVTSRSHDSRLNDNVQLPVSVSSQDPRLSRFFDRSVADLAGLTMATSLSPADAFVAAGAPWYLTLFGRDSIWAARMMLPLGTDIALGTLRTLAARQGNRIDRESAEEPGKIIHELRQGPVEHGAFKAGSGDDVPLALPPVYYGTVDATPLWVCLLHDAWRWGLAESEVEKLLMPMERCLNWIVDFGFGDRPFLSYVDQTGHGLANQGWKDSSDGVQFRDGRIATAPIALCEAQGYAYEAAMHGADLLDEFDRPGADRWREFAQGLARRFREAFWVHDADGSYPAIALDANGVPVDSLSSNIGHLLGTGLLDQHESELVAGRLAGTDLNSGFGLRTLAASSKGYNPLSYHCGSVWTHDTAIAIAGLRTVGGTVANEAAGSLIEGLLAAAAHFEYRLPELFGGDTRSTQSGPRNYPASCHPQAWSAASAVAVLAAVVGIKPDVPRGTVSLAPLSHSERLVVSGIRLSDSYITVRMGGDEPAQITGLSPLLRLDV